MNKHFEKYKRSSILTGVIFGLLPTWGKGGDKKYLNPTKTLYNLKAKKPHILMQIDCHEDYYSWFFRMTVTESIEKYLEQNWSMLEFGTVQVTGIGSIRNELHILIYLNAEADANETN